MRPRVLLIADRPGWSFDRNLRDLAAHLDGAFAFAFWYAQREPAPAMDGFDAIYAAHRWDLDDVIPHERAAGSLRSQYFDPTRPAAPTAANIAEVNRWAAFHTVTRGAFAALRRQCPRVRYLSSPVDVRRFAASPAPARREVIASWAGDLRHTRGTGLDVKGFTTIIIPACRTAHVPLLYAEPQLRPVAPDDMPAFYRAGSVALCASLYEGASNALMEAMAMGQAVIATDAGNACELLGSERMHFGDVGIEIVERSPEAFARTLGALTPTRVAEMGAVNRAEIAARWSWDALGPGYEDMLRSCLR